MEKEPESFVDRLEHRPDMPGDRPEIKNDYLATILAAGVCIAGSVAWVLNKKKSGGPKL